jgi:hypothetical protein
VQPNMLDDPYFWLNRLAQALVVRQARYDVLADYVAGRFTLPGGDPRYIKSLHDLQQKSKTNYISLVTNAPVERMKVVGFKFGDNPNDTADRDANAMWQANSMDLHSQMAHMTAAGMSRAYVLVSPVQDDTGQPLFTVEDPRCAIVERDPARPDKIRAGLRMWIDDLLGRAVAVLYMPDQIFYFLGNMQSAFKNLDINAIQRMVSSAGSWELVGYAPNPIGEVPLVELNWRPTIGFDSLSEAEEGFSIQDRINQTILDRMIISKAQAYKQRWAKGIKIPQSDDGRVKPPFDPGSDILWAVESKDAQFGEFHEADIRQILEAVRDDVGDLAAITKTPPHYLLGQIVNASGDALKAAETGLVAKTKERMTTAGWAWEKVVKLGFAYKGDARAKDITAETIWADPESRSRAELADAILKETQIGLPFQMALERLGLSPQDITRAVTLKKQQDLQDLMLQAAQQAVVTSSQPSRQNANGTQQSGGSSGSTARQ